MDIARIIEIMTSPDSDKDAVKAASRELTKMRIRKIYNLRIIVSLFANGHDDIARQYAAETNTDIGPTHASRRILERFNSN